MSDEQAIREEIIMEEKLARRKVNIENYSQSAAGASTSRDDGNRVTAHFLKNKHPELFYASPRPGGYLLLLPSRTMNDVKTSNIDKVPLSLFYWVTLLNTNTLLKLVVTHRIIT